MIDAERVLFAVAGGPYDTVKAVYQSFVDGGFIKEAELDGPIDPADDSENAAILRRFRIQWVASANPLAAYERIK